MRPVSSNSAHRLSRSPPLSGQVLASQKQLENKYKQAQATADDWYRRAQLALQKVSHGGRRDRPFWWGGFLLLLTGLS